MAAGRPVVATNVGVIPELVVDDETGLLVSPGDAGALAKGLEQLLGDRDRSTQMGASGAARARGLLSREAFASGLAGVLAVVCGADQGTRS